MNRKLLGICAAVTLIAGVGAFLSCSDDNYFSGGYPIGNVYWANGQGNAIVGAFGWNNSGVSQTALFSGTSCDNFESSVDIINGYSYDPCSFETNDDGSPFTGTIDGVVCSSVDDSQTDHTVTCNTGVITDTNQTVGSSVGFITIYLPTTTVNGDLGGRSGADAYCAAHKPATVEQANVRAMVSVSATDEIRDMPGNYGVPTTHAVFNEAGDPLADNWSDLLDGTIANPTDDSVELGYWTGSFDDGSLATGKGDAFCNGFTDGTSDFSGAWGGSLETNGGWLFFNADSCDATGFAVLCIAFD